MKNGQEFAGSRDRVRRYAVDCIYMYIQLACIHIYIHTYIHTYIHALYNLCNSYIPLTEQHELKEQMLFHLGNVTYLLHVTPSNPLPHPLSPLPIPLRSLKIWLLSNIQQAYIHTYIHVHTFPRWSRIHPMSPLAPTIIPSITFTHFLAKQAC